MTEKQKGPVITKRMYPHFDTIASCPYDTPDLQFKECPHYEPTVPGFWCIHNNQGQDDVCRKEL